MLLTWSYDFAARNGRPLRARPARRGWLATVELWRKRARERAELMDLGERELHDFGASRSDAIAEGSKPFWRA